MSSEDFIWYTRADLREYAGEYVAILNKSVVAHGNNAKVVWEEAKKKYPKENPALAKIPTESEFILWGGINSKISI